MRIIATLVRKDIANFLRNRAAVVLTFGVPMVMIYVFGLIFGLNQKDTGPNGIRLAVVNASTNPAAEKLVAALKAEKAFSVVTTTTNPDKTARPLTEADLQAMIEDGQFRFALVIPADLVSPGTFGLHLKILSDPRNDIESQTVSGLLQKAIFANVPQLLGQSLQSRAKDVLGGSRYDAFNRNMATTVANAFGGDPAKIQQSIESGNFGVDQVASPASPSAPGNTGGDIFRRIVKIEQVQVVGKNVKSPAATRVVGGWAIMFLLFAVSGSSAAFFDEENAGLFQRLLSSPVTRAQLLWSRFVYGIVLGLVQLTTIFAMGHLLYGIDVFGHFGNLVIICLFAAAACTSFGMLIAAIAPNAQAANGLSTFVVMIMSATGGAWFPMSLMPVFMQTIGKFTVVYWSMEGFLGVLWAEHSLRQLLPIIGILTGITVVVMAFSIWRLNQKQIFR